MIFDDLKTTAAGLHYINVNVRAWANISIGGHVLSNLVWVTVKRLDHFLGTMGQFGDLGTINSYSLNILLPTLCLLVIAEACTDWIVSITELGGVLCRFKRVFHHRIDRCLIVTHPFWLGCASCGILLLLHLRIWAQLSSGVRVRV